MAFKEHVWKYQQECLKVAVSGGMHYAIGGGGGGGGKVGQDGFRVQTNLSRYLQKIIENQKSHVAKSATL